MYLFKGLVKIRKQGISYAQVEKMHLKYQKKRQKLGNFGHKKKRHSTMRAILAHLN
jgi:hypothetical protein